MSFTDRLVLMGMKGCGKTTLGKMLAERYDARFVDTDSLVESLYKEQTQRELPFREIFARHGEDFFNEIEQKTVMEFIRETESSGGRVIVSLGGRTALNPNLRLVIKSFAKIIYIRVDAEELFARVSAEGLPAFIRDEPNPMKKFFEIYENRRGIYENLADGIVDTTGCSISEAMEKLIAVVGQLGEKNVG